MKVAGLDIQGSRIQAAVIQKKLGGPIVFREEELVLPESEGERTNLIAGTLKEWASQLQLKGVVVGLDLKSFSHHFVDLPVTSRSDIAHALQFEMEKYLPLPPQEYLFDFVTTETSGEGSSNLVFAVKKSRLTWLTKGIAEAGIRLMGVRCAAIEALNRLIQTESTDDSVFLYRADTEYCLFGIRRSVPVALATAISRAEAASKLKTLMDSFDKGVFAAGTEKDSFDGVEVKSVSYPVAQMLALSAFKKLPLKLDFVPEEFRARKVDFYPYALVTMCAIAVLAFFSATWVSYYKDYAALNKVNKRIEEIKTTSSELMEKQREFEAIDEKRQFLLNFQKSRNRNIRIITELSTILPKDAWLTNLTIDAKDRVEVQGYAKRSASLIGPLEKSDFFKNVEFSSPVTIRNEQERFSIKMEMEE